MVARTLEPITNKVAQGLTFVAVRRVRRAERELDVSGGSAGAMADVSLTARVCRSFLECGSAVAKINYILVFVLCGVAGEGLNILRFVVKVIFCFCLLVNIFGPLHSFLLELRADRGLRRIAGSWPRGIICWSP